MVAQAEKVAEVATDLSRAAQEQMDQSAQGLSQVRGLDKKKTGKTCQTNYFPDPIFIHNKKY